MNFVGYKLHVLTLLPTGRFHHAQLTPMETAEREHLLTVLLPTAEIAFSFFFNFFFFFYTPDYW